MRRNFLCWQREKKTNIGFYRISLISSHLHFYVFRNMRSFGSRKKKNFSFPDFSLHLQNENKITLSYDGFWMSYTIKKKMEITTHAHTTNKQWQQRKGRKEAKKKNKYEIWYFVQCLMNFSRFFLCLFHSIVLITFKNLFSIFNLTYLFDFGVVLFVSRFYFFPLFGARIISHTQKPNFFAK